MTPASPTAAAPTCKVALVQINNSFSGQNYLPYAVGLIEAYVRKFSADPARYEFLLPVYKRQRVEAAVERLLAADVVGFSTYVWNVKLSLAIARRLKERKPDILIVFGGPQVPDRTEAFLRENPFVDVAVNGEGEHAFARLLDVWPSRDWTGIANLSYLRDGALVVQAKGPRIRDLAEVPSPYLEETFAPLMRANPDENWIVLWETNRGCPFQCTFCDWGSATQAKVFQFDLPRLEREIAWFADRRIEFIFCCDANFGILARDIQLAESLARTKAERGYPRAVSVQNTKNATDRAYLTQKILSDAGMNKGVTLSMQSLDPGTLKAIKRQNIALDTYEELQRRFTRDRVETYSDLILGLPGETRAGMLEAAAHLSALPIAALKLHQLQLVRGTAMARDWERDPASVPLLAEDEYIALLADFVERLSPTMLLQRLGSEVPPALKLAPRWNIRLSELAPRLTAELARRDSWQGRLYAAATERMEARL